MKWIHSKYINDAEVVRALYGKSDSPSRGKFSMKKTGHQKKKFNPDEVEKLEKIRQDIIKDISDETDS